MDSMSIFSRILHGTFVILFADNTTNRNQEHFPDVPVDIFSCFNCKHPRSCCIPAHHDSNRPIWDSENRNNAPLYRHMSTYLGLRRGLVQLRPVRGRRTIYQHYLCNCCYTHSNSDRNLLRHHLPCGCETATWCAHHTRTRSGE